MNHLFTFHYDEKYGFYKFQSLINSSVSIFYVSCSAMKELLGSHEFNVLTQNDIGTAIKQYLSSKGISSTEENPLSIFSKEEDASASHALAVTIDLKNICKEYLNE